MNIDKRIEVFSILGSQIREIADRKVVNSGLENQKELHRLIFESVNYNGWFTPDNVQFMLKEIGNSLERSKLKTWLRPYLQLLNKQLSVKKVAVVMAGNIPAVGFHDLLSVLISGNSVLAKLSSEDNKLLPVIASMLVEIEPEFDQYVEFTEGQLKNFDAVIATGSNNSARYFDYYFGKYPHIIRKNRNGIAVLNGNESEEDLAMLTDDVFQYYGLGCRNVSKIFVPEKYDFQKLLSVVEKRKKVMENNKYFNNYEYNKAIYLVNGISHLDAGNLILVENNQLSSPVSVLFYETYKTEQNLIDTLERSKTEIQCVVASKDIVKNGVPFGNSQRPQLWDYADNVDVIDFLLSN